MPRKHFVSACLLVWAVFSILALLASVPPAAAQSAPQSDSATFDTDRTAHITRVVPMPSTVSPEAQDWLDSLTRRSHAPQTLEQRRKSTDEWRKRDSAEALKFYPAKVEETTTAGVRTDIITPLAASAIYKNRVLINLHGGGFNSDSGSLIEGVPISNLTKIKVVSVYYRLAPENPFPAAVEDVVAVYKDLLKTYQPKNIGIFGTSAGAILTGEVIAQLKKSNLPLPGAVGMFSVRPDFSRATDSLAIIYARRFPRLAFAHRSKSSSRRSLRGLHQSQRPGSFPVFRGSQNWPPSLFVTSTRDLLLSDTAMFHLSLLRAGNDTQLVVFEALPHAFWYQFHLPETKQCLEIMAKFFEDKLGR